MRAVVTLAGKTKKDNPEKIQTILLGYDPSVWMEKEVQIRDKDQKQQPYEKSDLPLPVKGKRKYSQCDQRYTDVHNFIANRTWAPTQED